ncbi:hypothetical protein, conserved [Eimeria maxima]|uniref:S1-like domain-containing protein n=1 Tax=Eimeria maxima TaxID=5804 RepID=U6M344_EIMMA|nr:hypothetical protein, conserved [Eimeria maxima]CDJ58446.1 hypothetical protein, conserved [Eimeria maxima]
MGGPLVGVGYLWLIVKLWVICLFFTSVPSSHALHLLQTPPTWGARLQQYPKGPPLPSVGSVKRKAKQWKGAPLTFLNTFGGPQQVASPCGPIIPYSLAASPLHLKANWRGTIGVQRLQDPLGSLGVPTEGSPRGLRSLLSPLSAKGGARGSTRGASKRRQREQQRSDSSNNSSSSSGSSSRSGREKDCLNLAGRVVACLPGGRFKVQLEAAAATAARAAGLGPVFGDNLEATGALKDIMVMCSLSGKLRINRVYVHLYDFVVIQANPLAPQEGRIVFRIKDIPSDPAAAAAAAAAAPAAAAAADDDDTDDDIDYDDDDDDDDDDDL